MAGYGSAQERDGVVGLFHPATPLFASIALIPTGIGLLVYWWWASSLRYGRSPGATVWCGLAVLCVGVTAFVVGARRSKSSGDSGHPLSPRSQRFLVRAGAATLAMGVAMFILGVTVFGLSWALYSGLDTTAPGQSGQLAWFLVLCPIVLGIAMAVVGFGRVDRLKGPKGEG